MLQPFRKTIIINIFLSYAQAFMQSQYLWFHMKNHQEARPYKCTKCPRVNKVLSQSLYFNSNYKPSYSHMQAFKQLAYCNKHISLCRPTKRQRINGPDDEGEPEESAVFHPVFEQIGPHRAKRCFRSLRRVGYLEAAIKGGYKSVDVSKRLNGNKYKLIK